MRIFGSSRVTKTSASCRTSEGNAVDTAEMPEAGSESLVTDLAATDEMPILRDSAYPALAAVPASSGPLPASSSASSASSASSTPGAVEVVTSKTGGVDAEDGDSDVFVCRRTSPDLEEEAAAAAAAAAVVTLFVYGWESVEPGPLSWAFPSLRAALEAVRTMRNAVEWCICAGSEWASIDAAREKGAVLVEQNA